MEKNEICLKTFVRSEFLTVSDCGRKKFDLISRLAPGGGEDVNDIKIENDEPGFIILDIDEPGRAKVRGWISAEELNATAYSTACMPFGPAHEMMIVGVPMAKMEEIIEGSEEKGARYLYVVVNQKNVTMLESKFKVFFTPDEIEQGITFDFKFDYCERERLAKAEVDPKTLTITLTPWEITEEEICQKYIVPFADIKGELQKEE